MKTKAKHSGFSLAELLISLAVMALILTAVAVAFNAASVNYNENREIFSVINTARQALLRITSQLRTAIAVNPSEASSQCSLVTAQNANITFRFDSAAKTLYLDSGSNSYVLCKNVSAITFNRTLDLNGQVKSVEISMTVTVDNNSQTVSTAIVLRKRLS